MSPPAATIYRVAGRCRRNVATVHRAHHLSLRQLTQTRRDSPAQRQAWLEAQIQQLHPGCTITVTITPTASPPPDTPQAALTPAPPPNPTA